jgi:hypothetical protein
VKELRNHSCRERGRHKHDSKQWIGSEPEASEEHVHIARVFGTLTAQMDDLG